MRNIAIIPTRSGSKGVRETNIRILAGKPLMAYTIEAALDSGQFDEVTVSTDSEKYGKIAREYGAMVPFLRSTVTASDTVSSWDMVDEVLCDYGKKGKNFDTVCLLQSTSPLRFSEDIKAEYELFRDKANMAVVSVCEVEHLPLWCGQLFESYGFIDFISYISQKWRQDAGTYYRLNGAIYIVDIDCFQTDKNLYYEGSFDYIMSQEKSIDIDIELDLKVVSVILGRHKLTPFFNLLNNCQSASLRGCA